ncbi:MAG: hypothetical protein ACOYT4_00725 [Nanoarchaeota archaeon]
MKYKYLASSEARNEIRAISNNLAEYLHENQIKSIIFLDRSARLGYIGLRYAWSDLYPNEKCPDVYFTNPEVYKRNRKIAIKEFDGKYKRLAKNKESKIMLFDTYICTGDTIYSVKKVMNKTGYKNIELGISKPKSPNILAVLARKIKFQDKTNFHALNYIPNYMCCPFGKDSMVEKSKNKIFSSRTKSMINRKKSLELRAEIKDIFETWLSLKE